MLPCWFPGSPSIATGTSRGKTPTKPYRAHIAAFLRLDERLRGLRGRCATTCWLFASPLGFARDRPSLGGETLYKLDRGDTFVYYSDGNTGKFLEIKDGRNTLRREWIQIILYPKLIDQ
jgi:hypothetical protein